MLPAESPFFTSPCAADVSYRTWPCKRKGPPLWHAIHRLRSDGAFRAQRALALTDLLDGRGRPGSEGDIQGQSPEDGASPGSGVFVELYGKRSPRMVALLLLVSIMP